MSPKRLEESRPTTDVRMRTACLGFYGCIARRSALSTRYKKVHREPAPQSRPVPLQPLINSTLNLPFKSSLQAIEPLNPCHPLRVTQSKDASDHIPLRAPENRVFTDSNNWHTPNPSSCFHRFPVLPTGPRPVSHPSASSPLLAQYNFERKIARSHSEAIRHLHAGAASAASGTRQHVAFCSTTYLCRSQSPPADAY